MKKYLQIFILFLALTSCSDGTDIRRFSVEEIEFAKMPIEVQAAIKEYYRPNKEVNKDGDTLTHYGLKDELICLDSSISKCEFEAVWSPTVRITGKRLFIDCCSALIRFFIYYNV